MVEDTFQRDDVVRRKFDGQKMFVQTTSRWGTGDLYVEYVWHDAKGKQRQRYAPTDKEPELLVQHGSSAFYRHLKLRQSPGIQTPRLLGAKLGTNLF
jgi:uncharacterized protein YodC (DUF2158 family)